MPVWPDAVDPEAAARALEELEQRLGQGTSTLSLAPQAADPPEGGRDVGHLTVIEHDGSNYDMLLPDGSPNYDPRITTAQRFYATHGDYYDFLVVFTNFEFETGEALAFHNFVRNDVRGIGKPISDGGGVFGSPGRLKGYVDMCAISRYRNPPLPGARPGDPGFLHSLNVLAHEIAHQWLVGVSYQKADGSLSSELRGRDDTHWSYLLDSDASLLYGSEWSPGAGGSFAATRVREVYSPLDLYLMGLKASEAVPDVTLIRNPAIDATQLPAIHAVVNGDAETVSVAQVVAAEGPRVPDTRSSQKEFRLGFVFLAAPGTEPSAEDLEAVDNLRRAFAAHFFALTHGVAVADTTLAEVPSPPTAAGPDIGRALGWLLAQQGLDGSWSDSERTAVRDTAGVLEALVRAGQVGTSEQRGRAWLRAASADSTDFVSRRALALDASLLDEERASLLQRLLTLQNPDGGFGVGAGYASDALDTALALRALKRLGSDSASAARAVSTLEGLTSAGGGWPVVPGGAMSTVVTSHALLALQDWPEVPGTGGLLGPALSTLLLRQNTDGGFGESPSTPFASALALDVLLRAGADADPVARVGSWLEGTQLADGSWNSNRFETALVIGALQQSSGPNLVVPLDSLTADPAQAREGDPVRIRAVVRNAGRSEAAASTARLYDGAPGAGVPLQETLVPSLAPGEDHEVSFTFDTEGHPGDRTLFVIADAASLVTESREDDNAASRVVTVEGLLADLVVLAGDVAVSPIPVLEGESATVSVTVRNQGERAAEVTILQLTRGDPRAGGTILGRAAIPALQPGQASTAEFAWDTTGQLGPHALAVTADADFGVAEVDEVNNELVLSVEVESAAPPGPDLEVASIMLDPEAITTLPQSLQVQVTVRNRGLTPATSTLALFDGDPDSGGTLLVEVPITLGLRSSTAVELALTIEQGGTRWLYARADPAEDVPDENRANNTRSARLDDEGATVDLEILPTGVTPSSVDLVVGETLAVTVEVRNRGTAPVADANLLLGHESPGATVELARVAVDVPPGSLTTTSLVWTAGFAGDPVPLVVRADPFGLLDELSESNNEVAFEIAISPSAFPNLQVDGADVSIAPETPLEGGEATVSATVRNTAVVAAGPFAVRFSTGDADAVKETIGEVAVPGLDPGQETEVSLLWSPVSVRGATGLYAAADPVDEIEESDEDDNTGFHPFRATGIADIVLAAADVRLEPGYPRAGEPVTVSATVRNLGGQAAAASRIDVYEGEPLTGTLVGSLPVSSLDPSTLETVSLSWSPASPPGRRTLSLVLDPDDEIAEQDEGNNVVRRTVLVQDADLYLTEPYFSPNGDGVKDETVLGYRATGPVSIVVSDSRGQAVRTLAKAGDAQGSVVWGGLNDDEALVRDGVYTISVEGEGGQVLARVQAVLDLNRTALHDAVPFDLVYHNLTCSLPWNYPDGPVWMPSEDEALFIATEEEPGFPIGLLRMGLDGQHAYVAQDPWYADAQFAGPAAVSPDGREVLMIDSSSAVVAVDLATGARRSLPFQGSWWSPPLWSSSGRWIHADSRVYSREGEMVGEIITPSGFYTVDWAWSPDSDLLTSGTQVVDRTGDVLLDFCPADEYDPYEDPARHCSGEGTTAVQWRGDGLISFATSYGEGLDEAYLADPDSGTVTPNSWLTDKIWSGGLPYWSPDGTRAIWGGELFLDGGTPLGQLLPGGAEVGPRSIAAHYSKSEWSSSTTPGELCPGKDRDIFAVTNLANLTVDLKLAHLPGRSGLLVRGTVGDRHLDHYQLDYASEEDPETWHPIGPAFEAPVRDDTIAVWVPPAPGTYVVRLRVADRAGNQRTRTRVVSWSHLPDIVNVTQSERFISPNGDGVQDAAMFQYLVIEPTRVEVRVDGPEPADGTPAPLVTAFGLDHPAGGPASFTWDGRDESNQVVPDGRYTVFVNELPLRVEVDSTPPDIALRRGDPRAGTRQAEVCLPGFSAEVGVATAVEHMHVVDPRLRSWSLAAPGSPPASERTDQVYVPETDTNGVPLFNPDGTPRILYSEGRPVDLLRPEAGLMRESKLLTAEDYAGNRSSLPVPADPERLLVLEGRPEGCRAIVEPLPRMLPPISTGEPYVFLPETHFYLGHSLRTLAPLQFEFREEGSAGSWIRTPDLKEEVLSMGSPWVAQFPELGIDVGEEHRGRFVTEGEGGGLQSREFRFLPCDNYLELGVSAEPIGDTGLVTYTATVAYSTREPLVRGFASVDSEDLDGFRATIALEKDDEDGVFRGTVVGPHVDCQAGGRLGFSAVMYGASGQEYGNDGVCAKLTADLPRCGYSLWFKQEFGYCSASPDRADLTALSHNSFVEGLLATIERSDQAPPLRLDQYLAPRTHPFRNPPGHPHERRIPLDLTGLSDGSLPVAGRLEAPFPTDPDPLVEAEYGVVVDRSPPLIEILEPPSGSLLCVTRDPETGKETVPLRGWVAENGPKVELSSPAQVQCPENRPNCRQPLSGRPWEAEWSVAKLPDGEHEIQIGYCDRAGNTGLTTHSIRLTRQPPHLVVTGVTNKVFSPNGDGLVEDTTVSLQTYQWLTLTAEIRTGSSQGPVVRTLLADEEQGATLLPLVWDGRDDAGLVAPDGLYAVTFSATDPCGGTGRTTATVTVDNTPPQVQISEPGGGVSVPASLDVLGTATDATFVSYELSSGAGSAPTSWTVIEGRDTPVVSRVLGRWDPPGESGPYTLRLTARDRGENEAETRVAVNVAPGELVVRLGATPQLFSPNGDGRLDTTRIEYELERDAVVRLEVRTEAGAVLRTLEPEVGRPAGPHALDWDGLTDAGEDAPEGDHKVWILAADPAVPEITQQHEVSVAIDRTPPVVVVDAPEAGTYLPSAAPVMGTVTDSNLADYVVTVRPDGGDAIELARGHESREASDLAPLEGLADGAYTLSVEAADLAENRSAAEVPFVIDSTGPVVGLESPLEDAVLLRGDTPVSVTGFVREANLEQWVLSFGAGEAPSSFVTIAEGTTAGDPLPPVEWAVASLPDGLYTLRLLATDVAETSSEVRLSVTLDGTPPIALLDAPVEGGYVIEPEAIRGTAKDANLERWALHVAPGASGEAYRWEPLAEGRADVDEQELTTWTPLPPDGVYTLRLHVEDRVGLEATALRTVTVDTTPPAMPTGLQAVVERVSDVTGDVQLTWDPNTEPDLAGYRVFRREDELTTQIIPSPAYLDPGRPEGREQYGVLAVDHAGHESPQATLEVRLNLAPPDVAISSPQEGASVAGAVDVRGTAFSADDFLEYRLFVGAGESPTAWTLLNRSTVPVPGGTLGEWLALGDGPHVLALEAEDTAGNQARVTRGVVVDLLPPEAPVLTAVEENAGVPDELTPVWTESPSPDVEGYLVYRNGALANAPGLVIGDRRGFLVPPPSYVDGELPDGEHCYWIVAMDEAGNLSPPSNEICRSLDNRPPRALIVRPSYGTRFEHPLLVVAFTPDTDIASIQFQHKPASEVDWLDLDAPRTQLPYETTLDPASLETGEHDLRAVATDLGGRTDPNPASIRVTYGDTTPPAPPEGLVARVDGRDVTLTWDPSSAPDIDSYNLFRDGSGIAWGLTTTEHLDSGRALGDYEYTVTAVDVDDNQSGPSNVALAVVYELSLDEPDWPVRETATATLTGDGSQPNASVQILREDVAVADVPASGGAFQAEDVPLVPDGNLLRARGEDAEGNRSVPSDEVVLIQNDPPGAVTGLDAVLDDRRVRLSWDPVGDSDLFGYLVRRGPESLTPAVPQTEATSIEATVNASTAADAFDDDLGTYWYVRERDVPASWTLTFPEPVLVETIGLRFRSSSIASDYTLQVRWEGRFVTVARVRGNQDAISETTLPSPLATDAVRIVFESQGQVSEVTVLERAVVPADRTELEDADVPDGRHDYEVTAVDRYGAEGAPATAEVPVGDVTAPSKPTGLVATPVGRDVVLTWDPNPEPDIAEYVVRRHGTEIGTSPEPTYLDVGLLDGTYVYTVSAVDAAGNESPESDPAEAVIAVAPEPPAAPAILVPTDASNPITISTTRSDVGGRADGGSLVTLDVNGETRGAVAATPGFLASSPARVSSWYPALSADGTQWAHLSYADGEYHIVVVDLASETERSFPIGSDALYSQSFSPTGTRIAFRQRMSGVYAYALRILDLTNGAITTLAEDVGEFCWSPDTRIVVASYATSELLVIDVGTLDSTSYPPPAANESYRPLAWSPDGSQLALLRQGSGTVDLGVLDLGTGLLRTIEPEPEYGVSSWSADGERLAYAYSEDGRVQVRVRDVETGALVLTVKSSDANLSSPHLSPSGQWLAFERTDPSTSQTELVAQNVTSGTRQTLEEGDDLRETLGWVGDRLAVQVGAGLRFHSAENGTFHFPDVTLVPGENTLVARATEPAAGFMSPDSEPVLVTVGGLFPDLAITPEGLYASPLVPAPGEPSFLKVRVFNLGSTSVGDVAVDVVLRDPSGQPVLVDTVDVGYISAQSSVITRVEWTPTDAGTYELAAEADRLDVVAESDETNNEAFRELLVTPIEGIVAGISADRTSYPAEWSVPVEVEVTNTGPPFVGIAQTLVEDTTGAPVALLDERPVELDYGRTASWTLGWNTGTTWAGAYRFRVRVETEGVEAATAVHEFTIEPDLPLAARVVPVPSRVAEGSPASFEARVENQGLNTLAEDLVGRLRVLPAGTSTPAFEIQAAVPDLLPGAAWDTTFVWPSAVPAGTYAAVFEVGPASSPPLAMADATLSVDPAAAALTGTIALEPGTVLVGETSEATVVVTNVGSVATAGYPLVVEIVSGPDASVLESYPLTVDLAPGASQEMTVTLETDALAPTLYPVLLRAGEPATSLALARLTVHGPISPPSIDSPADGASVDTSHPLLTVSNAVGDEGAVLTYEFELFADPELLNRLPGATGVAESLDRTSWPVFVNLAEDEIYYWRSRATDGFSLSAWSSVASFLVDAQNLAPYAPRPDSPTSGARVASLQPQLVVANGLDPEADPLTYELQISSEPTMEPLLTSVTGVAETFGFTGWTVPVTLTENAVYYWRARANDGENDSPWFDPVLFRVDTLNESPSPPVPIRPPDGDEVADLSPELVVLNSTDAEDDPIVYRFEIDQAPTFDSPALQASPEVAEQAAETGWMPPVPLADNTVHYWRAAAGDGSTWSAWSYAGFFVNLANDPPGIPVLLDPVDGRTVGTSSPTLTLRNTTDVDLDDLVYAFEVTDDTGAVVAQASGVAPGPEETQWTVETPLAEDRDFTWTARAFDGELEGEWAEPESFRVNAVLEPPTAPEPLSPRDEALVTGDATLVAANATSPEGLPLVYAFELYAIEAGGDRLVEAVASVPEGSGTTAWEPLAALTDGAYRWRAQASDPNQSGPWSDSAHFEVVVRPAPPTGLEAVPGDTTVALTWEASPEPDVVLYRVFRSLPPGGPYDLIGTSTAPAYDDAGLTNGITVHYVVTAVDADDNESESSAEASATPTGPPVGELEAEVRFDPEYIAAGCVGRGCEPCGASFALDGQGSRAPRKGRWHLTHRNGPGVPRHFGPWARPTERSFTTLTFDDSPGGGCVLWQWSGKRRSKVQYCPAAGSDETCPQWIHATVELPAGVDPTTIDLESVRLLGSVSPDSSYSHLVDEDLDGIPELEMRFAFSLIRCLLEIGANEAVITGSVGDSTFRGSATLTVLAPVVDLHVSPQTLQRRSHGKPGKKVQAKLTFEKGESADDVDVDSIRLNGTVAVRSVLERNGRKMHVTFDAQEVLAVLPDGEAVEVWVTGNIRDLPFAALDTIRVMD